MTDSSNLVVAAGVFSLLALNADAVVLLQTDFDTAAVQPYADGTRINDSGATTDNLIARANASSAVAVVDRGGGDRAMQFTDNTTDGQNPRAYSETFGGVSTTGTGDNVIAGSFTYTRLLSDTASATTPSFAFAINSGGQQFTGAGFTAATLSINSGVVNYVAGTTPVNSGVTLVTGREYRFSIYADFSDLTQDRWGLEVTDLSNNNVVLSTGLINTRAANVVPDRIVFLGGGNGAGVNASPFAQIDNISFISQPVPEPAGASVAAGALLIGWRRR